MDFLTRLIEKPLRKYLTKKIKKNMLNPRHHYSLTWRMNFLRGLGSKTGKYDQDPITFVDTWRICEPWIVLWPEYEEAGYTVEDFDPYRHFKLFDDEPIRYKRKPDQ
ncbi:hypothetical protein [Chitinophaga sp. Cy-1792]|uniref:hypothetical protein n=1 Tax=Chitinophaga sp. Cy-1792 TaxID=2608339 RepID=UPI00141E2287|nr:hypothetical protein [Chitinophaga sp. Cy-1792]NIG54653.1 hypothetical protein [Chitinophaga sp. Cy-1792]